jgi:hypothetical protein
MFWILILYLMSNWQRFSLILLMFITVFFTKAFYFDPVLFFNSCSYFLSNGVLFGKALPIFSRGFLFFLLQFLKFFILR